MYNWLSAVDGAFDLLKTIKTQDFQAVTQQDKDPKHQSKSPKLGVLQICLKRRGIIHSNRKGGGRGCQRWFNRLEAIILHSTVTLRV